MDKLIVVVDTTPNEHRITLHHQRYFGTEFYKGSSFFRSSEGFYLSSDSRLAFYPRKSWLSLPLVLDPVYAFLNQYPDANAGLGASLSVARCPFNDWKIGGLINAVTEYNLGS